MMELVIGAIIFVLSGFIIASTSRPPQPTKAEREADAIDRALSGLSADTKQALAKRLSKKQTGA